jgi:hypothetical protein|tara:strand:- start:137 stop:652 length:516 start_codon:yes stop_codon:yes gene_type:complete
MKIIDNFLEQKHFKELKKQMLGPHFPWYYQDCSTHDKDNIAQLTHIFYNYELKQKANGNWIEILDPILKKLNAVALVRIKANLTFKISEKESFHTDFGWDNLTTAIYYLNTNNGGTRFRNKIVKSVENRMVIMPANTQHAVKRHTDNTQGRFVINFNYFNTTGNGSGYLEE